MNKLYFWSHAPVFQEHSGINSLLEIHDVLYTVHATISERFLLRQYALGDRVWAGITR